MSLTRFTKIPYRCSFQTFSSIPIKMADNNSSLDAKKGSIGKEFTSDGSVGSTAQKVGGPFDKEGAIGKQFTPEGAVGGMAQKSAENPPVFDEQGSIGKQFTKDGAIGSLGEKVGGPFSSDGAVGKQFNPDGAVGGTVQENLGEKK